MIYEKRFNGQSWIVEVKNDYGATVERHKFESDYKASQYIREHTEQLKPQPAENKIMKGSDENKGIN
jgi:hypothetical protein